MEPEQDGTPEHRGTDAPRAAARGDRIWVHVVWEVLLAAAVVVAVLAVRREESSAFGGDSLRNLLVLLAAGILLGTSFALSLRAAVPNLAVGGAAVASGVLVAWLVAERDYDLWVAVLVTLGAAVALGVALAVVVVGVRAPAWAAGLGAALGLYAAVLSLTGGRSLLLQDAPDPRRWAWPLIGAVVLLSLLGGVLGLLPGIRGAVGRYRPTRDPAAGRGGAAGFVAALALVGSCVLAAGAGLVLSLRLGAVVPDDGLMLLAQAAAAALLGGASAHGRRGGILGTILAAAFLQLATLWLGLVGAEPWTRPALLGGALLVGLLVGRVVEAAGRDPEEPAGFDDGPDRFDDDPDPFSTQSYQPYQTGRIDTSGWSQQPVAPGYQPYQPQHSGGYATPDYGDDPRTGTGRAEPGGGSPFRDR
jgi:ribose/xylose/arabinose/galactoside ABC-type transport system permease subunit